MKRKLLSFGLLAAGLLTAGNVMAETAPATVKMTYVDGSNTTTSYGVVTECTAGYNSLTTSEGITTIGLATAKWGINYIVYISVDASDVEGTITGATLNAHLGYNKNRGQTYGVGYRSASTDVSALTYEAADRTCTLCGSTVTVANTNTSGTDATFDITDAFINDEDKKVTILLYETAAGGGTVSNVSATITYTNESAVTYNIKYVDDSGNTIKDAATDATAYPGTALATAVEAYNSSYATTFYDTDDESEATKKYVYSSISAVDADGNEASEISAGCTVTVTYNAYTKYSYSVTAQYGSASSETLASATTWTDDTPIVYYPVCKQVDGTYYVVAANSKTPYFGVEMSSSNTSATISYTADEDIVYYVEAEEIGSKLYNTNWLTTYSSKGASKILQAAAGTTQTYKTAMSTTAEGKYDITIASGDRATKNYDRTWYIMDSEGNTTELKTYSNFAGKFMTDEFTDITIPAGGEIYYALEGPSSGTTNDNYALDYIIVRKAAAETVTVTCTNADKLMCTYSNLTQDLVFPEDGDVKAYVADEYDSSTEVVHMTQITDVPKGIGVVLKATSADALTVDAIVSSGLTLSKTNYMIATTGATVPVSEDGYYNYILAKDGLFYYLESEYALPTGYAYLHLERTPSELSGGAKALKLVFDDEQATGINSVNAAATNGKVYNLQGIEVQNPTNGLYIKNGKKYIK